MSWAVYWLMTELERRRVVESRRGFEAFLRRVEPRLVEALVATYGPVDGRVAAADALSWAWEHWDRASSLANPGAYLYRVGQSAVRRLGTRALPVEFVERVAAQMPEVTPELLPALGRLSAHQRAVVLLVHGYGWSQRDVATMLDVTASTVHQHLTRASERLRAELEVSDAH